MASFVPRIAFFTALNPPARTCVVFIASRPGGFISSSCASHYRSAAEFSGLGGQRGGRAGGLGRPSGSNSSVRVKGRRDRFSFVPLVATRGEPFLVPQLRATHPLARYYTTLYTPTMSEAKKVCIVGSGNWGSAIAKIVGHNVQNFEQFDNTVKMWVFEELINGRKLTEIINETHENVKYLPNHILPANIVAVPDVVEAAQDADVLIFVLPHQFIGKICDQLVGKIKPSAIGLSLIKGFVPAENGGIELISRIVNKKLSIPMSVLMGANLAPEVADEKFCETTIGSRDKQQGVLLRDLIQTNYFRVVVVDDVETVEMCGALKNIVACGAGFVDGLGYGDNTKAAVIRLGLMEMIKFAEVFYPGSRMSTFFESCGVADLITTCYGGRNRRVSEAFVKTRKSIEELEKEMLNGQQLQGPHTADEVNFMLKSQNMEDRFPLFTAIHRICKGELAPDQMIDCIRNHPEHIVKNEDNDKRSKL